MKLGRRQDQGLLDKYQLLNFEEMYAKNNYICLKTFVLNGKSRQVVSGGYKGGNKVGIRG